MDRIKIALNLRKPGNYAFFCPDSRLHLTRSNPVGFTSRVTSAILMGLVTKSLLDVDGVVDLKTGKVKAANNNKENKIKTDEVLDISEEKNEQSIDTSENSETEDTIENSDDTTKEEETPKKRGRKVNK